jgi:hypothetical protein
MPNPDIVQKTLLVKATTLEADVVTTPQALDLPDSKTLVGKTTAKTLVANVNPKSTTVNLPSGKALATSVSATPLKGRVIEPVYTINIQGMGKFSDANDFKDKYAALSDILAIQENFFLQLDRAQPLFENTAIVETLAKAANKLFAESTAIVESIAYNRSHVFTENISSSEVLANSVTKPFTENTGIVDLGLTYSIGFGPTLNDATAITETLVKNLTTLLSETTAMTEAIVLSVGYNPVLNDNTAVSESLVLAPAKVLSDATAINDTNFTFLLGNFQYYNETLAIVDSTFAAVFAKLVTETLAIVELPAISVNQTLPLETVTSSEVLQKDNVKNFIEFLTGSEVVSFTSAVVLSEPATLTEVLAINFTPGVISENTTISEVFAKDTTKLPVEATLMVESALINNNNYVQDYVDPYYVGTSISI